MAFSCWSPRVTMMTAATVGTSAVATSVLDLAGNQFDRAAIACRVVFSATVGANTTVSFYGGLDGDVISTVSLGALTYTAASSATVIQQTLISGQPYLQAVVANADTANAVNAEIIVLGHYEHHQRRVTA